MCAWLWLGPCTVRVGWGVAVQMLLWRKVRETSVYILPSIGCIGVRASVQIYENHLYLHKGVVRDGWGQEKAVFDFMTIPLQICASVYMNSTYRYSFTCIMSYKCFHAHDCNYVHITQHMKRREKQFSFQNMCFSVR